MKKFYFALVTLLSVMFASCSSDDSPISGEEGHLYSITFKVTGHSPRGNAHLINLDGVKFKCEQTGVSQSSVDEPFSGTATYTTEGLVKEMTVQGVLYSTENGTLQTPLRGYHHQSLWRSLCLLWHRCLPYTADETRQYPSGTHPDHL